MSNVYERLGVAVGVNAAGTKTRYGGIRMDPRVWAAMEEASNYFVDIKNLNDAIGRRIATLAHAEAAVVTSGAASGVVLAVAGALSRANNALPSSYPLGEGKKRKIVIQKLHRGNYTNIIRIPGAELVEVGNVTDCSADELVDAISPDVVGLFFVEAPRLSRSGVSIENCIDIAHDHGLPIIVDAAPSLPPKSNLWKFVDLGADAVIFSGGKIIGGPQNTGFVVGTHDMVAAMSAHMSPEYGVGRPHKVSKEVLVGLDTAIYLYMEQDENQQLTELARRLQPLLEAVASTGLRASIEHDGQFYNVPTLVVFLGDNHSLGNKIVNQLAMASPPIFTQYFKDLGHLSINPVNISSDEIFYIHERLIDVLGHSVSGRWD
ncbi:MAG: hypothetical protein C7B47_14095 [Sulfobacillus thermosulfidooxidans]|uniref:L-seryl-tRNA(Ser) seleniumtransferase n=1 Tax=Sulfobacillus thermosulfidooxidans TaxID=28034 RepID=A0A2T2WR80_SULTH|nr:MAG: hypothetical protein C7B47_14095 [Sulfobacillus thermosulfidooxidans]